MAAATTTNVAFHDPSRAASAVRISTRNFSMTREAKRARTILGHAIEYLTEEFVRESTPLSVRQDLLMAVGVLMSLNREVHSECRIEPTFRGISVFQL